MYFQRLLASVVFLPIICLAGHCQVIDLSRYQLPFQANGVILYHLHSDSLFTEKQNILVAEYKTEAASKYKLAIAYSDTVLKKTSVFGEESQALVALNGSFFDVEKGGSVAYLESDGKVINRNRDAKEKWAKSDSLLNGAVIVDYFGNMKMEIAKSADTYEKSDQEKCVMFSGPMLLATGKILPLINSDFAKKRHPRSCLCETSDKSILLIAIDGRSDLAKGMNLREVQLLLMRLKCENAINLDGGGSTTLWVNDGHQKLILNKPSDKAGERPVANAITIEKR